MLHLVLIVWFWLPEIVLEYLSRESVLSFCQSVQYIMYRVDKQEKKKRALAAQIVLYAFALLTCCVEICEF